jgi:hypothetical protein
VQVFCYNWVFSVVSLGMFAQETVLPDIQLILFCVFAYGF